MQKQDPFPEQKHFMVKNSLSPNRLLKAEFLQL